MSETGRLLELNLIFFFFFLGAESGVITLLMLPDLQKQGRREKEGYRMLLKSTLKRLKLQGREERKRKRVLQTPNQERG